MLISRLSRRRIASPAVIGTITPTSLFAALLLTSSSARCGGRRLVSVLVAIQVFPAGELPGRVVRAAFPCPVNRRRDRGAAADRVAGPSVGRPELDREDPLRGRRRRRRGPYELPPQSGERPFVEALGSAVAASGYGRGHEAYLLGAGSCHCAGVRPWRRMTSPIAARSGGPPAVASRIAATSRKKSGPRMPGVTIASALASTSRVFSKWWTAPRGIKRVSPGPTSVDVPSIVQVRT